MRRRAPGAMPRAIGANDFCVPGWPGWRSFAGLATDLDGMARDL
jgi:hypothetical protein